MLCVVCVRVRVRVRELYTEVNRRRTNREGKKERIQF